MVKQRSFQDKGHYKRSHRRQHRNIRIHVDRNEYDIVIVFGSFNAKVRQAPSFHVLTQSKESIVRGLGALAKVRATVTI